MRCVVIGAMLVMLTYASAYCQPSLAIHAGIGGSGNQLLSLNIEGSFIKFDSSMFIQTVRLSTGYGLQFQNANYLPIELRLVIFHGTHHLDLVGGLSIQTTWTNVGYEQTKKLAYSRYNPTFCVAYRFEQENGGFSGRFGLGGFYSVGGSELLPVVTWSLGYAF